MGVFFIGWKRDLLRECVEPNPGPSLNTFVEKFLIPKLDNSEAYEYDLEAFKQAIKKVFRGRSHDHEHVRSFLDQHGQQIDDIFKEDSGTIKRAIAAALLGTVLLYHYKN